MPGTSCLEEEMNRPTGNRDGEPKSLMTKLINTVDRERIKMLFNVAEALRAR